MDSHKSKDDADHGRSTKSSNSLARLFKGRNARRRNESENAIREVMTHDEAMDDTQKRMINEILDLDEMTVDEIKQPRVDMIIVEDTETVRQTLERMQGTGYSRLPVFHEDRDNIIGIVHYKDLLDPILNNEGDRPVVDFAYDALFVPNSKDLFPLLSEMQTNRQQMAIVVDEYGGTDGLITVEDIVEEIVGEIIDESDSVDQYLTPLSDHEWLVDGRYPVEDAIELGWPVEESDDYETIAGWLMDEIEVVPKVGDEFLIKGFTFKIQFMRRRRILSIRVTKVEPSLAANEIEETD
ncbi:MAG: hemolysin family protein [Eggerthellaceae bacterium]|jgi:putative hemolysin